MSDSHENALPAAVRKQVEQADAIIAQLNSPEGVEQQLDAPEPEPKQEATPEPEPTPEPEAKPETKERTDWKQKYSVLQGKYNSEVPRLHEDIRAANEQNRRMQEQLNNLQAQFAAVQEMKKPDPQPAVSQDEIDQFGPDLIDVIGRKAAEIADRIVEQRVGKLEESVKQVDQKVAHTGESLVKSARERLYERLDSAVGNWRTINKDATFVGWLNEEDPYAGQLRGQLLRQAFEANDADRVIKFFKGFQQEHAVENSDPGDVAPEPKQESQEPQQNLEDLVAPGTPKTGSTGAQKESGKGRIWTQKSIAEFHQHVNELVRKHPNKELPDEIKALERDLSKAAMEDRIRP